MYKRKNERCKERNKTPQEHHVQAHTEFGDRKRVTDISIVFT